MLWHLVKRGQNLFVAQLLWDWRFIWELIEDELFIFLHRRQAIGFAAMVVDDVKHDLEHPRADVCARLEAVERLPRLQISFLHHVLGFGPAAEYAAGCRVEVVQMRHRGGFKFVERLLSRQSNPSRSSAGSWQFDSSVE